MKNNILNWIFTDNQCSPSQIEKGLEDRNNDIIKPLFAWAIYTLMLDFFKEWRQIYEMCSEEFADVWFQIAWEEWFWIDRKERKYLERQMKWKKGLKLKKKILDWLEVRQNRYKVEFDKIKKSDPEYVAKLVSLTKREIKKSHENWHDIFILLDGLVELNEFITNREKTKWFAKYIKEQIKTIVESWWDTKPLTWEYNLFRISNWINVIIDLYWELNQDRMAVIFWLNEEISSLNKTISELENVSKAYEASKKENTKKESDNLASHARKDQQISILNWEKAKLNSKITELNETVLQVREELKTFVNLKERIDKWELSWTDGKFFEDMCYVLEKQLEDNKTQTAELESQVAKQFAEIMQLKNQVEFLSKGLDNNLDKITASRVRCESSIDKCCLNDLLIYLTHKDADVVTRDQICDLLISYLDMLSKATSKWASSSTNAQNASEWWKWWWKFANNFVNPMINFLKQLRINNSSQAFLEKVCELDWKTLLREYMWVDLWKWITKKQKVLNLIYNNIDETKWALPLFLALEYIAEVLDSLEYWDVDLWVLASNIRDIAIDIPIEKDLRAIAKKLSETKK